MDMMTATHNLLFMTDDELIALERAIWNEQQRRHNERRDQMSTTGVGRWSWSVEKAVASPENFQTSE